MSMKTIYIIASTYDAVDLYLGYHRNAKRVSNTRWKTEYAYYRFITGTDSLRGVDKDTLILIHSSVNDVPFKEMAEIREMIQNRFRNVMTTRDYMDIEEGESP